MTITTVQIPEKVRRMLKILSAQRNLPYGNLFEDLIDLYEAMMPFKNDIELKQWFEKNYKRLGFQEVTEKKPTEIYVLKDKNGRTIKACVEFTPKDLARKGYSSSEVDLIICAFSTLTELDGIPIISLIKPEKDPQDIIKILEGRYSSVPIPATLYKKIEETIKNTGFADVSSYIIYILREILAEQQTKTEEEKLSKEDEEKVKQRLKALGYL